jgi:hypothetical protein
MPRLTPNGKVYTTDELINLAKIGQMGNLSDACLQAFYYIKHLEEQIQSQIPPGGVVFDLSGKDISTEAKDK